jgi:hypothetical protein
MGVFNIHPKGLSSITCSLMETETVDYQVNPLKIDMNESARMEVIYAQAEMGGSVRKSRAGLVAIKFRMVIFGTTQATAIANARTVVQALTNPAGGYIEYRPVGLSATVMTTYYHYLQSRPPKLTKSGAGLAEIVMEKKGQFNTEQRYHVEVDCEVMTKAWATSDPETPVTVVAATSITNHDDSGVGDDNFIIVPSSSIKGDAVLPFIEVTMPGGGGGSLDLNRLLLHRRPMLVGANTNLDWFECEDMSVGSGSWTDVADPNSSNGFYTRTNSASGLLYFNTLDQGGVDIMDETYIGKVSPLLCAWCTDGTTYRIRFVLKGGLEYSPDMYSKWVSVSGQAVQKKYILHEFGELDFPPLPVPPSWITGTEVGQFYGQSYAQIEVERTEGSGYLYLDFAVLANSLNFIARFEGYYDLEKGDHRLEIDPTNAQCRLVEDGAPPGAVRDHWFKYGTPFDELLMRQGVDHRLRFIFWAEPEGYEIHSDFSVATKGFWCTIFPFDEA